MRFLNFHSYPLQSKMTPEIEEIFEKITERFQEPIQIGSRCQSCVFYRVEDLSRKDLEVLAEFLSQRIINICSPVYPKFLVELQGSISGLAKVLADELRAFVPDIAVLPYEKIAAMNGHRSKTRDMNIVLVNDVITTARSCLEAHSSATMRDCSVLCWAALIDRTFGPGPVPIAAALTGFPVELIE